VETERADESVLEREAEAARVRAELQRVVLATASDTPDDARYFASVDAQGGSLLSSGEEEEEREEAGRGGGGDGGDRGVGSSRREAAVKRWNDWWRELPQGYLNEERPATEVPAGPSHAKARCAPFYAQLLPVVLSSGSRVPNHHFDLSSAPRVAVRALSFTG
jgi:hypothetical protein